MLSRGNKPCPPPHSSARIYSPALGRRAAIRPRRLVVHRGALAPWPSAPPAPETALGGSGSLVSADNAVIPQRQYDQGSVLRPSGESATWGSGGRGGLGGGGSTLPRPGLIAGAAMHQQRPLRSGRSLDCFARIRRRPLVRLDARSQILQAGLSGAFPKATDRGPHPHSAGVCISSTVRSLVAKSAVAFASGPGWLRGASVGRPSGPRVARLLRPFAAIGPRGPFTATEEIHACDVCRDRYLQWRLARP